jgi:hypothetical protein
MSKRHQSSRRRSYGRRQHELRERIERHEPVSIDELRTERAGEPRDRFRFLDLEPRRMSFVVSD